MQETNNSKVKLRKKITIIAVAIVVIALIGIAVTVVTVMNGNGLKALQQRRIRLTVDIRQNFMERLGKIRFFFLN